MAGSSARAVRRSVVAMAVVAALTVGSLAPAGAASASAGAADDVAGARSVRAALVWGHDGDTAGYRSFAFASRDGHHQVVLLLNADGESVPPAAVDATVALLDTAYCST